PLSAGLEEPRTHRPQNDHPFVGVHRGSQPSHPPTCDMQHTVSLLPNAPLEGTHDARSGGDPTAFLAPACLRGQLPLSLASVTIGIFSWSLPILNSPPRANSRGSARRFMTLSLGDLTFLAGPCLLPRQRLLLLVVHLCNFVLPLRL
ncbi:unnamed protein product, partial [Ectocarpus sp. 8 AP-2014]